MKVDTILPEILLKDVHISAAAKLVYAVIRIYTPSSQRALAAITGANPKTVSRLCRQLIQHGWVHERKIGRRSIPVPSIPNVVQEQMVDNLRTGFNAAKHKGEYISKAWLSILVATDDYVDNARPSFLKNPQTGEPLELDRWYPRLNVGFEYQGPQHFGPTKVYPGQDEFNKTRTRDLLKLALCKENGIDLIYVTVEDLTLTRMLQRLPKHLPVRYVAHTWPYIKEIEKLSESYRVGLTNVMQREAAFSY